MRPKFLCFILVLVALGLAAGGQPQLPIGYTVLRQFGKPCRIASESFPWLVYSSDQRYANVFEQALATWNAEGLRLGLGPLFLSTSARESAHLLVDWSGADLPREVAGGVFWDANLGYKRVLKLSMDGGHRIPDGNRTEILLQELGHVLGLYESDQRADIMYTVMHTRRLGRPSEAKLTQRDREAFAWLYGQSTWIPILALGQEPPRPRPPDPQPLFTPLPVSTSDPE